MNERQRRFVEAYMGEACGNGTRAAAMAGYAHPAVEASRLLKNPKIAAELQQRVDGDPLVASREERLRFLTSVMRGKPDATGGDLEHFAEPPEMRDRLKAAEMLCKLAGDFVERREISGPGGAPVVLFGSLDQAAAIAREEGEG